MGANDVRLAACSFCISLYGPSMKTANCLRTVSLKAVASSIMVDCESCVSFAFAIEFLDSYSRRHDERNSAKGFVLAGSSMLAGLSMHCSMKATSGWMYLQPKSMYLTASNSHICQNGPVT